MNSTPLFIYLFLPLIGWIIQKRVPLFRKHVVLIFLPIVLIGSLLHVKMTRLHWEGVDQLMSQYDLNGDGKFSSAEMTPEAHKVSKRLADDTGRQLAPFFAPPAIAIWTGGWFLLLNAISWLCRKLFRRKPSQSPPLNHA